METYAPKTDRRKGANFMVHWHRIIYGHKFCTPAMNNTHNTHGHGQLLRAKAKQIYVYLLNYHKYINIRLGIFSFALPFFFSLLFCFAPSPLCGLMVRKRLCAVRMAHTLEYFTQIKMVLRHDWPHILFFFVGIVFMVCFAFWAIVLESTRNRCVCVWEYICIEWFMVLAQHIRWRNNERIGKGSAAKNALLPSTICLRLNIRSQWTRRGFKINKNLYMHHAYLLRISQTMLMHLLIYSGLPISHRTK